MFVPSRAGRLAAVAVAGFIWATPVGLEAAPEAALGGVEHAVKGPAPTDTIVSPGDTIRPIPLEPLDVSVLRAPLREDTSPLAVGVLTEAELRRGRSGAFLADALLGLPGVQVQNRHNFAVGERISVRGFGGRAQFGVRGIRVLVDGIPATLPDGQTTIDHLDIGSLGRVEVVRGPASALYGNASGGVLSFRSRTPWDEPVGVEVESVMGSHGLFRNAATAAGTVHETGYLISFSAQGWDGYRINPRADEEGAVYGQADRLGLNARVTRSVAGGELGLTVNLLDLEAENPGSLPLARRDDPERWAWGFGGFPPDDPIDNVRRHTGKDLRQGQAGLRWEGPVGSLDGDFSLFGVRRSMVNPIPSDIIVLDRDGGGVRAQLGGVRDTERGALRWYAGVEGDVMFDDRLNYTNASEAQGGEPVGDPYVDQRERVRGAGGFVQLGVPLPGGGEGLAGLRYDRHDYRAWDRIEREPGDPSATGTRRMDAVSPSVGISMPVGGGVVVFGNVGTVYETPSTTELGNDPDGAPGFNPDLEPQTGVAGELGLRGKLGTVGIFEVTTYRTDLRNELVRFQVEDFPGRDFFRNAGRSRHRGIEATLALAPGSGLIRGDLAYSWNDARFRSFVWDDTEFGGNRIPGLAPHRLQTTLRLDPDRWFGALTGSYLHRVPVNDGNTEFAPSHFLLDLRAGARGLSLGNVGLAPWAAVINLLDRHHIASVVPNAFGGRFYEPGPGRSFQFGLRATWGAEARY
jgi:iron complex outermembrane recepter protein